MTPNSSKSCAPSRTRQIWAIAGGKGGTGKTVMTSSLGILLSKLGYKVILIDVDLGSANLHTCLGIKHPKTTLSDFLFRKGVSLESLISDTPYDNLKILSGSNDELNIANLQYVQKTKLIRHIKNLPADFILLDLGAGTNFNVLDFFLAADQGILMAIPEPTSVENVYRFLRSTVLRIIKNTLPASLFNYLIKNNLNPLNGMRTVNDFLIRIKNEHREFYDKINSNINAFVPKLVINQTRTKEDIMLGSSIRDITIKYLYVNLDYIGYVAYDRMVHEAIKRFKPFVIQTPNCDASMCIKVTLNTLLETNKTCTAPKG